MSTGADRIPPDTDEAEATGWASRVAWGAIAVSTLGLVGIAAAADRGFDFSDEGWYLLASRFPDQFIDQATPTRFQFLTGDLYRLVDEDVTAFRLSRLVLVTAAALLLGVAVLRLLRHIGVGLRRSDRLLTAAAIILSSYGANWLPQSPGYNDTLLVLELLFAAAIIGAAVGLAGRAQISGILCAVGAGMVSWFALMTKFSAAGALLVLSLAVPSVAGWRRRGDVRRWLALALGGVVGFAAGMAIWHTRYATISDTLDGLRSSVRTSGQGSVHTPGQLLGKALIEAVIIALLTGLAIGCGRATTTVTKRRRLAALAVALLATPVLMKAALEGNLKVNVTSALVIAMLMVAVAMCGDLAGILPWPRPRGAAAADGAATTDAAATTHAAGTDAAGTRDRAVVVLFAALALTPILSAFGTANSLTSIAAHGCIFSVLACLVLLAGRTPGGVQSRAVLIGVSILVLALAGVVLTWRFPFNQPPLSTATATVDDRSPLRGLRLDASAAGAVDDSMAALGPGTDGRFMLGFWALQGFVFATDSETPGEIFEPTERAPTVVVIDRACASGRPIYIATDERELESWVLDELRSACGVEYPRDSDPVVEVPRVNLVSGPSYAERLVVRRLRR